MPNFISGELTSIRLTPDGGLAGDTSVVMLGGNPHSSYPSHDNACVFVPNLGLDTLQVSVPLHVHTRTQHSYTRTHIYTNKRACLICTNSTSHISHLPAHLCLQKLPPSLSPVVDIHCEHSLLSLSPHRHTTAIFSFQIRFTNRDSYIGPTARFRGHRFCPWTAPQAICSCCTTFRKGQVRGRGISHYPWMAPWHTS